MEYSVINNRKVQIREAAQNLFREKGYSATSMRDLAKVIGIEPASLYSHISSKEDLLKEICFRIADEFFEAVEKTYNHHLPADEVLRSMIIAHICVIKNNLDASAVFLHEWRFLNEPALSEFRQMRKQYEIYYKNVLERGIADGTFADIDLKVVLPTIFSSMNWTYDWAKPSAFDEHIIGNIIFEMIYKGIKA